MNDFFEEMDRFSFINGILAMIDQFKHRIVDGVQILTRNVHEELCNVGSRKLIDYL